MQRRMSYALRFGLLWYGVPRQSRTPVTCWAVSAFALFKTAGCLTIIHRRLHNVWMLMNQNVFRLTLPILFGYIPLGMAFGVLFTTQLDYAWWIADRKSTRLTPVTS